MQSGGLPVLSGVGNAERDVPFLKKGDAFRKYKV